MLVNLSEKTLYNFSKINYGVITTKCVDKSLRKASVQLK